MTNYDVIVIGAGIEGSSSAYHLAKKGMRVLLLEQFLLPHTRGSSHGQNRLTRHAYVQDFYVHMMTDAFPMWDELEKESGEDLFLNCGIVNFHERGSENMQKIIQGFLKYKVPFEMIESKQIKTRFPGFKLKDNVDAMLDISGGVLRADRCLRAFQTVFKKMGGTIRDGCQVTSVSPGETVKVVCSDAIFSAPNVVIAAGPWAGSFAKSLDLNIPIQPIKVSVYYWKPAEEKLDLHKRPAFPCFIDSTTEMESHIYGFPCEEYPNLVKICLHSGPEINPDERDTVDTSWTLKEMRKHLKKFPWLSDSPSITETCIYTNTPDNHPYIDRHPLYTNIIIAAGFSGHGFKLAPAVGNAVTQLVQRKVPTYDMQAFKLDRFKPKAKI